ncbi:Putative glucose-methanol-choline oxidoreductase, FAD/NAD(P)-binding domain superfamily [Colletotrichum destructivum]|uniref:Glucose-methanol-choline oxidoreductase, FAD/NAD(P)-binding domain superfamily n=1 Tax=Colletotrichum destructivum TaxID=34406 RepID=A0AAX4J3L2_9PEZI|nr:Putative glucose-methanol-choline oxidoreductase, FAD/NAD(P)-binding domain superfamily [Colletotrichum destructivum]
MQMLVKSSLTLASAALALAAPFSSQPYGDGDAYDYIVVGGGTAGVAVAARLSEGLPASSILLIEAGPAAWDEPKINVPGMKGSTLGTKYDWNFTTVAQPHVNGRVFTVNRGRVLGGSSALNLMSYDRAAVAEYDSWEALGNPGWNWETMIAAMKKSETFTGINTDTYGSEGVGDSGPVQAVINRIIPEHQDTWIPTMNALGVKTNLESLGGNPLGVMYQPSSIDPAHYNRSYSANAYVPLAGSNLFILPDTTVAKINLGRATTNSTQQRATGVTLKDGTVIQARKEVILSAGSIQSPGLLELSGIGQASVLNASGIEQLIDLPGVGENLQDHLRIQSSYQLKPEYLSFDILRSNATFAAEQLALWNAGQVSLYDYTGSGYTFSTWAQALGNDSRMVALAKEAAGEDPSIVDQKKLEFMSDPSIPQLEVIFSDGYTGVKGYPAATSPLFSKGFFTLIAAIMHPMSRGSIHINPADAAGKPIINPNYLGHEHDLEAAVQAIKYCRRIAQTEPMRSTWESEYEPGLDAVQTDEQWRQFALNTTLSIFHPVGTCSMLPKKDGGVVDADLKVYGTANLRVVDASVIPLLISAHVQTAVYGIAEIAAERIIAAATAA